MIYFIQSGNYVKVGYTSNMKNRYRKYVTENPEPIKLIGKCKGGLKTEKKIHAQLHEYHYRGEWFHLNEEVRVRIREIIKENRDNDEPDQPTKKAEKDKGIEKVYDALRRRATGDQAIDITIYTRTEIANELGIKIGTVTKHIAKLLSSGRLTRVASIFYLNV